MDESSLSIGRVMRVLQGRQTCELGMSLFRIFSRFDILINVFDFDYFDALIYP